MKKISILFISLFFASITFAQPDPFLDDLFLEIDNMNVSNVVAIANRAKLTADYKTSINSILNDLSPIKRNNTPSNDPTLIYENNPNCPCGYKSVTITASYTDFARLAYECLEDKSMDYVQSNELKSDAKEIIKRIKEYLDSRGIDFNDVSKLEIVYTGVSGNNLSLQMVGVKITYTICAPCPH